MGIKDVARRAYFQAQKEERDTLLQDFRDHVKERLNLDTIPYDGGDVIAVQGEGFFFFLNVAQQLVSIAYGQDFQSSTTLGHVDLEDLTLETLGHLLVKKGIE